MAQMLEVFLYVMCLLTRLEKEMIAQINLNIKCKNDTGLAYTTKKYYGCHCSL